MAAIKEERVSAVFLSTPWLSFVGGCCRQPLAPSASSFVVLSRYDCCTMNYRPRACNLQLAQSQDCANIAQSMDCVCKAWIHTLSSAIHGLCKIHTLLTTYTCTSLGEKKNFEKLFNDVYESAQWLHALVSLKANGNRGIMIHAAPLLFSFLLAMVTVKQWQFWKGYDPMSAIVLPGHLRWTNPTVLSLVTTNKTSKGWQTS